MKILRCADCRYSSDVTDSWGYSLCMNPVVNSKNADYLGGMDRRAMQCSEARGGRFFAKCGLAGKLWEQAEPKEDQS